MYEFPSTVWMQYISAFGAKAYWREVVVGPVRCLIYLTGPDFAECGNKGPAEVDRQRRVTPEIKFMKQRVIDE